MSNEIRLRILDLEWERDSKIRELKKEQAPVGMLTSGIGEKAVLEVTKYYQEKIDVLRDDMVHVEYDYHPKHPTLTLYPKNESPISYTFRPKNDAKSAQAILFEVFYERWDVQKSEIMLTYEDIIKEVNKKVKGSVLMYGWFNYTKRNLKNSFKEHPAGVHMVVLLEKKIKGKTYYSFNIKID